MTRRTLLVSLAFAVAGCIGFAAGRISSDNLASGAEVDTRENFGSVKHAERPSNQMIREPVIGIASLTSDTYVRAIRECGGIPVVLPNADGSVEEIGEYLELLDGLIMPGGPDIPPSEYGEDPHPTVRLLDDDRYQFEKAMISAWIQQTDKPLLGICLGVSGSMSLTAVLWCRTFPQNLESIIATCLTWSRWNQIQG